MKITGIGTSFVDYFFEGNSEFLKKNGLKPEDDFLFGEKNINPKDIFSSLPLLSKSPGGNTPNTLAVLSKLGIKTSYLGVIGTDEKGEFWEKNIGEINLENILRKGNNSFTTSLLTNRGKERTFLSKINENDNDSLESKYINYLDSSENIFLGPLFLNPKKNIRKVFNLLDDAKPIFFSPGIFYINLGIDQLRPILRKTRIVFLNENEIVNLLNKAIKEGSAELLKYGPQIIVCTMGEKGALITTNKEQFFSPGIKAKKVVDTTGAGDAFAAGFIYGILKKRSLRWSANFANEIGAKSVTDYGLNWLTKI